MTARAHLRFAWGIALLLLAAGCGSSAGDSSTPDPSDAGAPGAAIDAAAANDGAALDANAAGDADVGDSVADADAGPEGSPSDGGPEAGDPCAAVLAPVAACEALVGTTNIPSASVLACIDEMTAIRAPSAAQCLGDGGVAAFDATAFAVLTSALSLTQPACDATSMSTRIRWLSRFVQTARSLASPAFVIDHPALVSLNAAFWQGLYSGDPRASALDATSLRTLRTDALDCAKAALDAAYTPDVATGAFPLTTAPLVGITSEALAALAEGYDRTTVGYELGCRYTACASASPPAAGVTWGALGALDDGAAMRAALNAAPSTVPAWGGSLARVADFHDVFEGAVLDAIGASTYAPSLLVGPGAADLPFVGSLVAARDHARALIAAFATDGTYTAGPPGVLDASLAQFDYPNALGQALTTRDQSVDSLDTATQSARSAFVAKTGASFDVRPLESTRRDAMVWAARTARPIIELATPGVFAAVANDYGPLEADGAPAAWGLFDFYAVRAIQDLTAQLGQALLDAPPMMSTMVAVTFANPAHVAAAGEPSSDWSAGQAASAAALWKAITAGGTATITLSPDDVYSLHGGFAILGCQRGAPVVEGIALQLEYYPSPPSGLPPNGALTLPLTAPASRPFMTVAGQVETFVSSAPSALGGAIPASFAKVNGVTAPTTADGVLAGASLFGDLTVDVTALHAALAAAPGGFAAPSRVTLIGLVSSEATAAPVSTPACH